MWNCQSYAMQSSTGSTSLLSALAVPGSACTTGRGSSGCRGKAHFGSDASSNFNSTDIYMLVMFTDGGRWNKLLAGRESDNYARISVTYCISAAGAHALYCSTSLSWCRSNQWVAMSPVPPCMLFFMGVWNICWVTEQRLLSTCVDIYSELPSRLNAPFPVMLHWSSCE